MVMRFIAKKLDSSVDLRDDVDNMAPITVDLNFTTTDTYCALKKMVFVKIQKI